VQGKRKKIFWFEDFNKIFGARNVERKAFFKNFFKKIPKYTPPKKETLCSLTLFCSARGQSTRAELT
jgi:hypothetical protein